MKCIEVGFARFSWGACLSWWQAERFWVGILADGGILGCYAISYFEISTCGDMVLWRSIWHDICVIIGAHRRLCYECAV
jgi:hypothetical protein